MAWNPEYASKRRERAKNDPEYREKRRLQGAREPEANKAYMKEYYKANPDKFKLSPEQKEKRNQARREKYANDPEFRERHKNKVKEYYLKHPKTKKEQHLRSNFGITLQEYDALFGKQKGKCAICGTTDSGNSRSKYMFVDHNHETGEIRGLLCSKCNFGIGQFNDDINLLKKAIQYLNGGDDF